MSALLKKANTKHEFWLAFTLYSVNLFTSIYYLVTKVRYSLKSPIFGEFEPENTPNEVPLVEVTVNSKEENS
jgi:hypothetical protein